MKKINLRLTPGAILLFLLSNYYTYSQTTPWVQQDSISNSITGSAALAIGSKGYICGGQTATGVVSTFCQWKQSTNTWTPLTNYPAGNINMPVSFTIGSKGYVGIYNNGISFSNQLWAYDSSSNTWSQMANFPGPSRYGATSFVFVVGHKAYMGCGTADSSTYLNDVWEYDAVSNIWTQKNNFPGGGRANQFKFSDGTYGYAGCGEDSAFAYYDSWQYDPIADSWSQTPNFPDTTGICAAACFNIGSIGYVGTGLDAYGNPKNSFWAYDAGLGAWSQVGSFTGGCRKRACGFAIGNNGYLGMGCDSMGNLHKDFWQSNDVANFQVGNTTVCAGNPVQYFLASSIIPSTILWTFSGGNPSTSNLPNPSVQYSSSGFDSVTLSVTYGHYNESTTQTISITVNPLPSIVILGNNNVCNGSSTMLSAYGANTYAWSTGATNDSISVMPSITTIDSVIGTDTNGCSASAYDTINVHPIPIIKTTSSPFSGICQGSQDTLMAYGGESYLWNDFETTSTIFVTPPSTTQYYVTGTDSNGCSSTDSLIITVYPIPTISISSTNSSICIGNIDTLIATGDTNYLWSNGATTSTIIVSPTSTTTYTVIGISPGGCNDTITYTLNVDSLPLVSINSLSNTLCTGTSEILSAYGANSYLWSDAETTSSITVSPTTTTIYSVVGTSAGGCTANATDTIIVNPAPVLKILASIDTICSGTYDTLIVSGGDSYLWSTGDTTSSVGVHPGITTTYSVIGYSSTGCSSLAVFTINVIPGITITASPSGPICSGSSDTLYAMGSSNYKWSNGATTSSISVSPSSTTIYSVYGIGTGGCYDTTQYIVSTNCGNTCSAAIILPVKDTIFETDSVIANQYKWYYFVASDSNLDFHLYNYAGSGNIKTMSIYDSCNGVAIATINAAFPNQNTLFMSDSLLIKGHSYYLFVKDTTDTIDLGHTDYRYSISPHRRTIDVLYLQCNQSQLYTKAECGLSYITGSVPVHGRYNPLGMPQDPPVPFVPGYPNNAFIINIPPVPPGSTIIAGGNWLIFSVINVDPGRFNTTTVKVTDPNNVVTTYNYLADPTCASAGPFDNDCWHNDAGIYVGLPASYNYFYAPSPAPQSIWGYYNNTMTFYVPINTTKISGNYKIEGLPQYNLAAVNDPPCGDINHVGPCTEWNYDDCNGASIVIAYSHSQLISMVILP